MRRFTVYYRRGRSHWRQLQPGVHDGLCNKPEVREAIRYMRDNPAVEGVAVRVGDELFNVMAVAGDRCYEFAFPEG